MLMKNKFLATISASILLIGIAAALVVTFSEPDGFRGTFYIEPYPIASEIDLARSDGSSFRLSEMQGNLVLIFFGYTSCPDVCPTTLAELNQALAKLDPKDAMQVKVVFITVDPQRDTPDRVQDYVARFNPEFIGLSGSESELGLVWNNYGVFREITDDATAAGYLVNHTSRVSLIDRDGRLRVSFAFGTPVGDIVHDLQLLLKE